MSEYQDTPVYQQMKAVTRSISTAREAQMQSDDQDWRDSSPYHNAYLDVMRELDMLFENVAALEKHLEPIMGDLSKELVDQNTRADPSSAQSGDSAVIQDLGRFASKIKSVRLQLLVVNGRVQL